MSSKKERRRAKKRNDRLRDEAWEEVAKGRLDLGLRLVQRALDRAPGNARYWHDQGVILERLGRIGPAIDSHEKALELSPRYADALRRLAELREGEGDLGRALELFETLVDVEPVNEEVRLRCAGLRSELSPSRTGSDDDRPPEDVAGPPPTSERTERFDWAEVEAELARRGCCLLPGLLRIDECEALIELDGRPESFEHEVQIGDRGAGESRYRFFARPLPELVQEVREEVYGRVAPIANRWNELLDRSERFPARLEAFLERCREAGQHRTTPLLFRYERGASNHFHRDLAGRVYFPLQLVVTLGPGNAADGGGNEFLLADVRTGKRKKVRELRPGVGDGVLFCTRDRLQEVAGLHGLQPVKHGVGPLLAERRYALGVPFHDYR